MPSRSAIEALMRDPYITAKPPKSTDGPAMVRLFESLREMQEASYLERVATATVFATAAIQLNLAAFLPAPPDELIVSGGGTRNLTMMTHLRKGYTTASKVLTTDELGFPSSAKEAIAFALLGAATLDGVPSNVPSVTGARRAVVLGSITPNP
jgi:anhydro-N-acetylmuramic acid kinase